jgi:AI-2 transport protein TqsA
MVDNRSERNWLVTGSLVFLAAVAASLVLHYTSAIMIPFVLAIFIVQIVAPVMDFLILKLKFPKMVAVAISLVVVFLFIGVLIYLVADMIQNIVVTASQYSQNFTALLTRIFELAKEWDINIEQGQIIKELQSIVPKYASSTFGSAFGFLTSLLFVIIFVLFLLLGRDPHKIRTGMYADMDKKLRRYIVTKLVLSAITGFLVWVILSYFDLKLAAVFGLMAFLLNFIPSIGSIIATLLPLPIAFAQYPDRPFLIGAIILAPGIVQFIIGNVIDPKVTGEGLNIHPVVIILSLAFWGMIWGPVGMLLAVPVTAIIRIILMQTQTLKPVGDLLAGILPEPEEEEAEKNENAKTL